MNMTPEKEGIVRKVQALLARADQSSNAPDAERDAAMRHALKMLAEHNLQMTDIQRDEEEVVKDIVKIRHGPWARMLWKAIAKLYFCEPLFYTTRNSRAIFYGREVDVKIAREIAFWIQERLWSEGLKVRREMGGENVYLTSFLNAASWRIGQRCDEIIRAAARGELGADGENMLVPMSVYEQAWQKAREEWPDDVRTIEGRQSINDYRAAMRGVEEAEKMNLGRQISDTGRTQRRIGRG